MKKYLPIILSVISFAFNAHSEEKVMVVNQGKIMVVNGNDTTIVYINPVGIIEGRDTTIVLNSGDKTSIFNKDRKEIARISKSEKPKREADPLKFAWGLDVGSSIDMTAQDLTAIDMDICIGLKNKLIRFAGIGGGIKMMSSNSSRCYPVYGMLRTSFNSRPSLCFLEAKAGMSFNNLYTDIFQNNFIGGIGVGITLAKGKGFSSHITVSYEYMRLVNAGVEGVLVPFSDLHSANIKIGACF